MIANTPADRVSCDSKGCISQARLLQNICGTLAGKVEGYACEVGAMAPAYGGKARSAVDGEAAMSWKSASDTSSKRKIILLSGHRVRMTCAPFAASLAVCAARITSSGLSGMTDEQAISPMDANPPTTR